MTRDELIMVVAERFDCEEDLALFAIERVEELGGNVIEEIASDPTWIHEMIDERIALAEIEG